MHMQRGGKYYYNPLLLRFKKNFFKLRKKCLLFLNWLLMLPVFRSSSVGFLPEEKKKTKGRACFDITTFLPLRRQTKRKRSVAKIRYLFAEAFFPL